jgi:hypothetical protein
MARGGGVHRFERKQGVWKRWAKGVGKRVRTASKGKFGGGLEHGEGAVCPSGEVEGEDADVTTPMGF